MNTVIELLQKRASSPKLDAPAPTDEEVEQILRCGLRAPDHGRLKPWRFHIVQGAQLAELGHLFADIAKERGESDAKVEKSRNMPLRAPLMIVATCHPYENSKIPVTEQILAVGAAIQNMQVAISSLGYSSIWRTGECAYEEKVKRAFDVPEQGEIVGFLYIGTPTITNHAPEVELDGYVKQWIKP
ncbi:nitroreductase [Bermanella marisrubri]|uniref:Putative NAD(P)H nitroreductase n=1 Tax=Bermanella marisrubri TaxID=207949 RepID=Q1N6Q9_9GAMM|nr:nitroreductase [Bermanella marisrubri]EAT13533.1 hypothetical protein RED65_09084 [Oceanobacter sp. RED65] [Bermanella marisrubri]QIZ84330.1 nitroreductase [Bermanella marisrubri]